MSSLVDGLKADHASAILSLVVPSKPFREYAKLKVGRVTSCIFLDIECLF